MQGPEAVEGEAVLLCDGEEEIDESVADGDVVGRDIDSVVDHCDGSLGLYR